MKLTEDRLATPFQLRAYQPGEIKINQEIYAHSLLISQEQLWTEWSCANLDEITDALLLPILEYRPECVIFGAGPRLKFPHPARFAKLLEARIGYEVMDTASACRTLVALFSERRRVMGGLIP